MAPLGALALALESAERTSSSPMPKWNSLTGSSSTRTAGSAEPLTKTWPTPEICDSCWASSVLAASYICTRVSVFDVRVMMSTGASAGFTLR